MRQGSAAARPRLRIYAIALGSVAISIGAVLGIAAATALRFELPDASPSPPSIIRVAAGARTLATVRVEAPGGRIWIPLRQMPRHLVSAVLSVEDRRFFDHAGVDLRAVVRAALANASAHVTRQGASTITQQLARTLFLGNERTWGRKIPEALIAVMLELRYDKPRILEAYLNTIYLGQDGREEIRGVGAAARYYWGVPVERLGLAESALLAEAIHAPNRILGGDPGAARAARNRALAEMHRRGDIDEVQLREASAQPIAPWRHRTPILAPFFIDVLQEEMARRARALPSGELQISSTLDFSLQQAAEQSVEDELHRIERKRPDLAGHGLQAAVVAMDAQSGAIRALVGGRKDGSRYNRAVRSRRQPGSAFKPFVYLTAFESPPSGGAITPASQIDDAPIEIRTATETWAPQNLDRRFRGAVTVREALEQSLNVPTIRLAESVGNAAIIGTARALGITSALRDVPSLALGTSELSLLELTSAYAALANGGQRVTPTTLASESQRSDIRFSDLPPPVQAVSPEGSYLITEILRGVMRAGTGRMSARWHLESVTAGKSGSTSELRDAWFVGYTPTTVIGVWVGLDDDTPLGMTGSEAALPIWGRVMAAAIRHTPPRPFAAPEGIRYAVIDKRTGRVVNPDCVSGVLTSEVFRAGTEPELDACPPGPGEIPTATIADVVSPNVVMVDRSGSVSAEPVSRAPSLEPRLRARTPAATAVTPVPDTSFGR